MAKQYKHYTEREKDRRIAHARYKKEQASHAHQKYKAKAALKSMRKKPEPSTKELGTKVKNLSKRTAKWRAKNTPSNKSNKSNKNDKYGTKKKKRYLKYYKKERAAGRLPMKYGTYTKRKRTTRRTREVSSSLKKAGLSYEEISKSLRGKK